MGKIIAHLLTLVFDYYEVLIITFSYSLTKYRILSHTIDMELKPGYKTTEFAGVIVSMLVSSLVMFKVVPLEQAAQFSDQLLVAVNLLIQSFTVASAAYIAVKPLVTYIQGRVALKQAQLQAAPKV